MSNPHRHAGPGHRQRLSSLKLSVLLALLPLPGWAADGLLDLGGYTSYAYGISSDGSVVVGTAYDGITPGNRAFRWTQTSGMVSLGLLNNGIHSYGYGVSSDGKVVVGIAYDGSV